VSLENSKMMLFAAMAIAASSPLISINKPDELPNPPMWINPKTKNRSYTAPNCARRKKGKR
jgi:hypothetical protein